MSLLPLWSDDFFQRHLHDWDAFSRDFYYDFNLLLPSRSLFNKCLTTHPRFGRHRQLFPDLRNIFDVDTTAKTSIDRNAFQVRLDVKDFIPNEISVKTIDNAVVVEAKHEERKDSSGYISRQFKRRYTIPREFNIHEIDTQLSSDGMLTINVPRDYKAVDKGNIREIKIQQTGPARLGGTVTRKG